MSIPRLFSFYGAKHSAATRYPAPRHDVVVEPFAGSAGYSCLHHQKQVRLYDADHRVVGVWQYLIRATQNEVRRLPVDPDRLGDAPQEARWLIGFWMQHGRTTPATRPSAWMLSGERRDSYWGPVVRELIAQTVPKIRHWTVEMTEWPGVPDVEATWFVDPPYNNAAGRCYSYQLREPYQRLGDWCRTRRGQVIVCENAGAAWLPFRPFGSWHSAPGPGKRRTTAEVIWTNDD